MVNYSWFLVAILATAVTAGPFGSRNEDCSLNCKQNNKFFYEIGREYVYTYEAATTTELAEDANTNPSVRVTAKATIQPLSPCEYILSLSEVSLEGTDKTETFAREVTRRPLRFSFQDGRVEHVCGSGSEPEWVVNFKKGVLSTFQNSMDSLEEDEVLTETDVSGICETSYSSSREGSDFVITRTKDLSSCTHKPKIHQTFSTFGFSADSLIQGLSILNSDQKCSQVISGEIMNKVVCEENHLFNPFRKQDAWAKTSTKTSLHLSEVRPSSSLYLESFGSRKDLLFDETIAEAELSSLENAETILSELEILTERGIKKEVPSLFSELVTSFRSISSDQILSLYRRSGSRLRTFISDALPLVGTAESTSAFVNLIVEGDVSEKERNIWYTSLSFIKNPTADMFLALQPLLDEMNDNKALLGISSLMHNYCLKDDECTNKPGIQGLLRSIESRLGIGCRATSEEEKANILYALKALGNVGHFVNAESVLKRCYLEENSMEIRIAAIDAWRRTSCSYDRTHFLSMYSDQNQDNELRIAAYLALMKCPTQELINTLKDRLTSEGVNQVESFVWSHLLNLQETADRDKQWIRNLIGEEFLNKKFSNNTLKMSRNYESSFYLTEHKLGATMDSNVIFSGKSFLPRSSMFDMTINLFGETINLFEIGGRIEGFEAYIEKFFGPDGYYPEETMAAIVKGLRQENLHDKTFIESFLTEDSNEPQGSYYLKVLGNELYYRHFEGIENALPEITFSNIFDVIMKVATDGSVDYTKSYDVINSEFTIPTITGFPIILKLNGTATLGLKLDGNFDFEDFTTFRINGKLYPSSSFQLDASMMVDTFVTKSGIKMESTLHSSSGIEGKVQIKDGKVADLTVNVPDEKIEILDISSKILKIENDIAVDEEKADEGGEVCYPFICKSFGMEICTQKSSYSSSMMPFVVKFYLKKTDTHSSYIFHYSNTPEKTLLLFDMPNSQRDNKWSASLIKGDQKYELNLNTPFISVASSFSYVLNKNEIGLEGEISVGGMTYKGKFNVGRQIENNKRKFKANVLLSIPNMKEEVLNLKGMISYDVNLNSLQFETSLRGYFTPSVSLNFNLDRNSGVNVISLDFKSPPMDFSLSGRTNSLSSKGLLQLEGTYRYLQNPAKSLTAEAQYDVELGDANQHLKGSLKVNEFNFDTTFSISIKGTEFHGKSAGRFLETTWDIESDIEYVWNDILKEVIVKRNLNIPSSNTEITTLRHFRLSKEDLLFENSVKAKNYNELVKAHWKYGESLSCTYDTNDTRIIFKFLNFEVKKTAPFSYDVKYLHSIGDETVRKMEGSIKTTMEANEFNTEIYGFTLSPKESEWRSLLFHSNKLELTKRELQVVIGASERGVNLDFNLTYDEQDYVFKIDTSPVRVEIQSNLFDKLFNFLAQLETKEEEKSFSINLVLEETKFEATGTINSEQLEGAIKYNEQEARLSAQLHKDGIELEAELSPEERFALSIHSGVNEESYLEVSVETPFKGWEKQDMRFSMTTADTPRLQLSITWQNTHHLNIIAECKEFSSSNLKTVLNCGFRLSSTVPGYERFQLSLRNIRKGTTINTKLEGNFNSEVIKGNLDASPVEGGYKAEANLKTPFTKDFSLSFDFHKTREEIVSALDFTYGVDKSRILLKGNFGDFKNINASLISVGPFLPELTVTAVMKTNEGSKNIEIKGKFNGKKLSFLAKCEKFVSGKERHCILELKLVTSSYKVFSGSFNGKLSEEKEFNADILISSSFIPGEGIKGHVDGKFASLKSAILTGYISGPNFNGKMSLNHLISNQKLRTEANFEINSVKTNLMIEGNINLESKEGALNGEIQSSIPFFDGYRVNFQHSARGDTRETFATLKKGDWNLKLYDLIKFKDYTNWSNFLKINDVYSIKNEITNSGNVIEHKSTVSWYKRSIDFDFQINTEDQIHIISSLDTPWTYPMKITLHHERNGLKKNSQIKIEYSNGRELMIESDYEFKDNKKTIQFSVFNDDWIIAPIKGDLELECGNTKSIDLNLQFSQYMKIVLQGYKKADTTGSSFTIQVNQNDKPIKLNAKHSSDVGGKKFYLEYERNEKYAFTLGLKGNKKEGEISSLLELPSLENPVDSKIAFNLNQRPMKIDIVNNYGENVYKLNAILGEDTLTTDIYTPSGDGKINMKWENEQFKKSLVLDMISPCTFIKDTNLKLSFENEESKVLNVLVTYGQHHIECLTQLTDGSLTFDSKTSFDEWKTIKAELEFTNSKVVGTFARNNEVFKFDGEINVNYTDGKIEVNLTSPYQNYEHSHLSINYSINAKSVNFLLDSNFGTKTLKFVSESSTLTSSSKQWKVLIQSPFELLKKLSLDTTVENDSVKCSAIFNEYLVNASLKNNLKENLNGVIMFTITSNIPGWTSYSIEAEILLSKNPHSASLNIRHEEQLKTYTFSFGYTENNFDLKIMTPIPSIENINAFGEYRTGDNQIETSFTVSRNSDNFSVAAIFDFEAIIPRIKLTIRTPLSGIEYINVAVSGNMLTERSIDFLLQIGEEIYKINIATEIGLIKGTASVNLNLPIEGYRNVNFQLSYNLNENKHVLLHIEQDQLEKIHIEGKLLSNEFNVAVESPLRNYRKFLINGRYEKVDSGFILSGKAIKNDEIYKFEGTLVESVDGYKLETNMLLSHYDSAIIKAEVTKEKIVIQFGREGDLKEISMNYLLKRNSTSLSIRTPFKEFSYFSIGAEYSLIFVSERKIVSGKVFLHKNNDQLEMEGEFENTTNYFDLNFKLKATDQCNYSFRTYYNLQSLNKEIGIIFKNDDETHKFMIEFLYEGTNHGFIKVVTSYPGFELNGFEYKFITTHLHNTEVYMSLIQNSKETKIGLINIINKNELTMKVMTPFSNYKEIGIETNLNIKEKTGMAKLSLGVYSMSFETSLNIHDFHVFIKTPFDVLKVFKVIYNSEIYAKNTRLICGFTYNDIIYELNGDFQLTSKTNPKFNFKIKTPHSFLKLFDLSAELNLKSPTELFSGNFALNDVKYLLEFGYVYQDLNVSFNLNAMTPIDGWKNTRIFGKFDMVSDTKTLDFTFEKENLKKMIFISGKILDEEIDFDIQMPFESTGNLRTRGSFNRSKRSVDMMMMNDFYSGGVVASFNSLKIKAQTPFEQAKDVNFDISKNNKGGWFVNYARNGEKVFFTFSAEPKKKGFSISVESEVPGWELLAVTGRLDPEEIVAYIEGKMTTGMVHISGSGMFGDKSGSLTITTTTPFDNYNEVVTTVEYNAKRNIFTFDSHSSSSDYKILLEFKRGLTVDVYVPNAEEDTVIKGKLTLFKGSLTGSSRFEAFRTFSINYQVVLGATISSNMTYERNGLKVFELEFERDSKANTAHLMIHGRRGENHSMLHFHRERWEKLEFKFSRNGKEFLVSVTGSDSLPMKGQVQFTITNSFRFVPRTVTGSIDIDRTSSPKKVVAEVQWHTGKAYFAHLDYNIDLRDIKQGDFSLRITTPERSMAPWKDISGNWNFADGNQGNAVLNIGPMHFTGTGKIGIRETDLVFDSNVHEEKYLLQWKISGGRSSREYYLKAGREGRYVMVSIKGNIKDVFNGDIEGAFRISRFMPTDFTFTSKWSRSEEGLTGSGEFTFGEFSGTHTLTKLKRDPNERAATFHWEASSNIPNFNHVVLNGEYNLYRRYVDIKLSWDSDEFYVKGALDNVALLRSENTLQFHLPKLGDGEITLSHDFTDPLSRSITAIGNIGSRQVSYVINWTRNEDLTLLNLNGNFESAIFGSATLHADFDLRNIDDAKGSLDYKRNDDKYITINWSRKKTSQSVLDELTFSSHFELVPNARVYFSGDWGSKDIVFETGIEWRDQAIVGHLSIGAKNATASLTTPFENFGDINLNINYDLKKAKSKSVSLKYTRGDKVVELNFNLKIANKKTGTFHLELSSPLEVLRSLTFDANWKKGNFHAVYTRNDVTVEFDGNAEVKADKSSFDLSFTMPNGQPIEIEFSYDLDTFVKGTGKSPKDILHIKLNASDHEIEFNVKGYRTSEKIYLEINGESSLDLLQTFYVKVDSELNLTNREGDLEIKINEDFHFHVHNTFEKKAKGFYARSQIHSTLTALPGLTIGFGREADSFIFTTGYGDEREITFTFKGKDGFRKGFYGTIDMPRRGIHGVEYSVNYNFKSDDKLQIDLRVKIDEGRYIEADIIYNSDGVKARLLTPWTGLHSARAKRSISDDYFMADVGIDDYSITYESDERSGFKKGIKIEGNIFGEPVLIYGFLNLNSFLNSQGKLIVETPFENFRKLGGSFVTSLTAEGFNGEIDMNLIYPVVAKINLNTVDKIEGSAFLQLGKWLYELNCNFVANESNVMNGNITIKTPHTIIEEISIKGTIISSSLKDFQGEFEVSYPRGHHNFNIIFKIDEPMYSLDLMMKSNNNYEYRLTSTYSVVKDPLEIKGGSSFYLNGEKLFNSSFDVLFNSVEHMKFTSEGNYLNDFVEGKLNLEKTKDHIRGDVFGQLWNKKRLNVNFNIPTNRKEISVSANYKGIQSHSLLFTITNGIFENKINFQLESTLLSSSNLEVVLKEKSISLIKGNIGNTDDKNRSYLYFEYFPQSNNVKDRKLVMNMGLKCPFMLNCSSNVDILLTSEKSEIAVKLNSNEVKHMVGGNYERVGNLRKLHIYVQSPLISNDTQNLWVSANLENVFKCAVELDMFSMTNSLQVEISKQNGAFITCISPFIPTGMFTVQGNLKFEDVRDAEYKLTVANAEKSINSEGRVKFNVDNESEIFFELRTPFENYEKIQLGFNYIARDLTEVSIFAYPFNFDGGFYFGNRDSTYTGGFKLRTGVDDKSFSMGNFIVPLTKFGPEFSVLLAGTEYNASAKIEEYDDFTQSVSVTSKNLPIPSIFSVSYKMKAPYEIHYHYGYTVEEVKKLGIIFDSSFLVLLRDPAIHCGEIYSPMLCI